MYQAPEVHHLERAVAKIKNNLLPSLEREPDTNEKEQEPEEETEEDTVKP